MLTWAPVTSLSQLRLRPWTFSTHQLATSWLILEGGSPSILAKLERPAIYFNGFLFWCSALMLFCCMAFCRPLTARTDDCILYCLVNFRLPWERSIDGPKNNNNPTKIQHIGTAVTRINMAFHSVFITHFKHALWYF